MRPSYYDEELDYIRRLAAEFGARHHEAAHLVERGQDPDVERLLEGFAFLAAQVREKLDDDFPELTNGLFSLLWPSYLRPIPSLAIQQFKPRAGAIRQSVPVPRGAQVASEDAGSTVAFRYQTCWDVTLHPLELESAAFETLRSGETSLLLQFALVGQAKLESLALEPLRLYLHGDGSSSRLLALYLQRHVREAVAWGDTDATPFPVHFVPVGFRHEESVLPATEGVPDGYRLMQEYFVFPQKFGFLDLAGLAPLGDGRAKARFSVRVTFDEAPDAALRVDKQAIRLFCTPVVNVFSHASDPVLLAGTRTYFPVRPAGRDQSRLDIWSVDAMQVRGTDRVERTVPWFYAFGGDVFRESPAYFTVRRELAPDAEGFQTYVSIVQPSGKPQALGEGTASFELTCTNGRNAGALDAGALNGSTDSSPTVATFENITKPTPQIEPPQRVGMLWRLLSLLAANHATFASAETLKMTLELMAALNAGTAGRGDKGFALGGQDERVARDLQRRIRGIRAVRTTPADRLYGGGMIRGTNVAIEVDPETFDGLGSLFLFGAVMDEFLAGHATINTFTRLEVHYGEGRLPLAWRPRLGREQL